MSLSSVSSPSVSVNETFSTTRSSASERHAATDTGIGATLLGVAAGIATGIEDGVSATVSFSGKALHALEQAGESTASAVVDAGSRIASTVSTIAGDAEDLAVDAWHGLEHGTQFAEDVGEAVGSAIATGAEEIGSATWKAGKELGHYAQVGLTATGNALSDVASGTVMAASAAGRNLIAML